MDLKASNVFLTKTYSIAKIGDVDMAQVMGSTTLQLPHNATFAYAAPELILHGPCNEKVRGCCVHGCISASSDALVICQLVHANTPAAIADMHSY